MRTLLNSLLALSVLAALAGCASQPPSQPAASSRGIDPSAALAAGFKVPAANNGNQASQSDNSQSTAISSQNSNQANSIATDANNDQASANDFPTIPDGSLYTIYCLTIDTPTHVPDANRLKEQLIRKTNLHDWYVIHGRTNSKLYYGFYKAYDDSSQPAETARAQHDLHFIQAMKDDAGDYPFLDCIFQPLDTPDPPAPAAWDLRNAKGYWSLQIAAYVGSPLRKQYAVDAVREARAMGIEAYFYHGKGASSVCVGCWPRDAIQEQDSADASTDVPSKHILVLPQPLPQGTRTDDIYTADGEKVKVMVPRIQVLDPTLTAMMEKYPHNAVNGAVRYHYIQTSSGEQKSVGDPSFLVIIPHGDNADGTASGGDDGDTSADSGNDSSSAQGDNGASDQQTPAPADGADGIEGN